VPAVFSGVYAKGHAGEVVFTVPGITRCYRCTTTSRHQDESQARTMDYGTGRLEAEPALGVDIQHIVTSSVKVAIGLLELGEDNSTSSARELVFEALNSGYRNYLILSTVPGYGFFRDIFADTPAQHAYQAVWMSVTGDPACSVCGTDPIDPLTAPSRAPRIERIMPVLDADQHPPGTSRPEPTEVDVPGPAPAARTDQLSNPPVNDDDKEHVDVQQEDHQARDEAARGAAATPSGQDGGHPFLDPERSQRQRPSDEPRSQAVRQR